MKVDTLSMRSITDKTSENTDLRVEVLIPIKGHNSVKFFTGDIVSISRLGALLHLSTTTLKVGDRIKFKFDSLPKNLHIHSQVKSKSIQFEAVVVKANKPISIFRKNFDTDPYFAITFDEPQDFILEDIHHWSLYEIEKIAA